MKKTVPARAAAGSGARKLKGDGADLREKQRQLNEDRTHEFSIDAAGHFILVSYQPASKRLTGRSRAVVFDSNLPDPGRLEYKAKSRLYEAVAALRKGAVEAELRSWLAGALQRLADQVSQANPDWDARSAFEIRPSTPKRPADAAWIQPFMALDVEFGRASGHTVEDATEGTRKAWLQSYDAVGKAHKKWSKACRKIVSTVKREDARDGIAANDSAAAHLAGLRLFRADRASEAARAGNKPGRRTNKRRA